MPVISFDGAFAALVESGAITQTIRKPRTCPVTTGDKLVFCTGFRTDAFKRLGRGFVTEVKAIDLKAFIKNNKPMPGTITMRLNGFKLAPAEAGELARLSGFGSLPELVDYIHNCYGLPFSGVLIRWNTL